MTDTGITTLQARIVSALSWMKKQRQQNLDMVTDAGDASLWCKDEADTIRGHMSSIRDLWRHCEELNFLRHEGGPQSVAAMEAALRDVVLPILRRNAEDLLRCVSIGADAATISGSDWRDIAADLEAVLSVETFVGRPNDEFGRVLDPVLDAQLWRHHS